MPSRRAMREPTLPDGGSRWRKQPHDEDSPF
jgi:hypothetical protein